MQEVLQLPAVEKVVDQQDLVMDRFRKNFKLVAGCNVSEDGKVMTYQMQTLAGAARWLSIAEGIISANRLPLTASVKAYQKKGEAAPHKVELRIVYNS
jgi:hypothetical protein